ncbi:hypothetical protein [Streptomyces sulphureus]|uniref:hypothetical protein n=1 Tax=Streptomyces sulphureus TaxID=47758 RepID=UPI00131A2384|nr:hypothetical protein [Streptomyces sulphureus]
MTVDPRLRTTLGDDIEETRNIEETLNAAASREISVLPPGRKLVFLMDNGHEFFASDLPRRYTVTVKSSGPFGAIEPLTYVIDLAVLEHSLLNTDFLEWSMRTLAKESVKQRKAHEKQATATANLFRTLTRELRAWRSGQQEVDQSGRRPEINPPDDACSRAHTSAHDDPSG